MKKHKKTITVFIILLVAVLIFGGFYGIEKTNENGEKVNLIPNINLGMEFGDTRIITATVNNQVITTIYDSEGNVVEPEEGVEYTEENGYTTITEKTNEDSVKTIENYEKTRKIITERLEKSGISEFFVDLNEENGTLKIEIPENANSEEVQDLIENSGSFMLLDGETFEVVLDSTYLKKANVMQSQGDLEMGIFLQIELNEEGIAKLKQLSEEYVETTTTEINEEGEEESVTNSKQVWVILNDSIIGITVVPNIVYNDSIMLTFGISNDNSEIQTAITNAEREAMLLNSGTSKIVYNYTNEVVQSKITVQAIFEVVGIIAIVFIICYAYLVIKFKANGFISVYFQVGFVAVLILVLKFTGAVLTIEGFAGLLISVALDYVFSFIILSNISNGAEGMYKKSNLEFFLNTLPIYAVAVVFTFAPRAYISSFGTILFWGILMIYVFNFIFSKYVYENLKIGGKNENT